MVNCIRYRHLKGTAQHVSKIYRLRVLAKLVILYTSLPSSGLSDGCPKEGMVFIANQKSNSKGLFSTNEGIARGSGPLNPPDSAAPVNGRC